MDAIFGKKMKALKFVLTDLMMIQRIHLLNCTLKLTLARSKQEQIGEQQRQADIESQMNDNDSESDDAIQHLNLLIIV